MQQFLLFEQIDCFQLHAADDRFQQSQAPREAVVVRLELKWPLPGRSRMAAGRMLRMASARIGFCPSGVGPELALPSQGKADDRGFRKGVYVSNPHRQFPVDWRHRR